MVMATFTCPALWKCRDFYYFYKMLPPASMLHPASGGLTFLINYKAIRRKHPAQFILKGFGFVAPGL